MMSNNFKFLTVAFLVTLFCTSCSKVYFDTQDQTSTLNNYKNISSHEVSIGEWITYIVATSFQDNDRPIHLGEHLDRIATKLPESDMGYWHDFVFKSLLKKSNKISHTKVYNHCTKKHFKINVPTTAWDSIVTYKLYELPIVGISYEQVLDYLAYKKDVLNNCKQDGDKTNEKYIIDCFLASPDDFNKVIKSSYDSWVVNNDSTNIKGCSLYNFKNSLCEDCPIPKYTFTHPVLKNIGQAPTYIWNYYPTNNGLYNIFGNVAEMTSVKGIAMGGSFREYAKEISEHKIQKYTKPEPWLGFRVWFRTYAK
jgi:hypothetical protein